MEEDGQWENNNTNDDGANSTKVLTKKSIGYTDKAVCIFPSPRAKDTAGKKRTG